METTRETLLILLSTPLYVVIIGLEMLLSRLHDRKFYTAKGTFYNIYLMLLNMGLDVLMLGVCIYVLNFFSQFQLFSIEHAVTYWIVLLVAEDFLFYVLHYVDHYCRL